MPRKIELKIEIHIKRYVLAYTCVVRNFEWGRGAK